MTVAKTSIGWARFRKAECLERMIDGPSGGAQRQWLDGSWQIAIQLQDGYIFPICRTPEFGKNSSRHLLAGGDKN
jgi:hypothetical protein